MDIHEELEEGRRDALYVQANREAFMATYADQWIAVLDRRLVATAETFDGLLALIDERGVSRSRVYFEFLSTDDTPLVVTLAIA